MEIHFGLDGNLFWGNAMDEIKVVLLKRLETIVDYFPNFWQSSGRLSSGKKKSSASSEYLCSEYSTIFWVHATFQDSGEE